MKESTENNTSALTNKVYHPPVIIALGEMIKGIGDICVIGFGEDELGLCTLGSTFIAYCVDGDDQANY